MRAIQITSFGEASEALELVHIPEPQPPGPGEVLIEMEFAPINPNDLMVISGNFTFRPELPSTAGNEGVGRIISLGKGVKNVTEGDRVIAPRYGRTWCERMVIPADDLFPLPEQADVKQLAMLRINPSTAGLLLNEFVDLKAGDWIVQNAANSGVGRSVIAIAKSRGIKTINLVRRPELIPEIEAACGDIVLLDRMEELTDIGKYTHGEDVKLALDGVSGPAIERLATVLAPGAVLVGYARMGGVAVTESHLDAVINKRIKRLGFYQAEPRYASKIPAILRAGAALIATGQLVVPIAAIYKPSAFRKAVEHSKTDKVMFDLRAEAWS